MTLLIGDKMTKNINDASLANLKPFEGKWRHGETRTIRVPIALAESTLEYARIIDTFDPYCGEEKIWLNQELIQQLQLAISILTDISQQLAKRQDQSSTRPTKLSRTVSLKNDPIEFYITHCTFKEGATIVANELFLVYKQWCNNNGSLSRGRRPFLDAIAQLGAADNIHGVTRGKGYTFKNLALKTE
jgi:hypothetical protein